MKKQLLSLVALLSLSLVLVGTVTHYTAPIGRAGALMVEVGTNIDNAVGALKMDVNTGFDSTLATRKGIKLPFEFTINRVSMDCRSASGNVDDTVFVFHGSDTLLIPWGGAESMDTVLATPEVVSANVVWTVYNDGGSVHPDRPSIRFWGEGVFNP